MSESLCNEYKSEPHLFVDIVVASLLAAPTLLCLASRCKTSISKPIATMPRSIPPPFFFLPPSAASGAAEASPVELERPAEGPAARAFSVCRSSRMRSARAVNSLLTAYTSARMKASPFFTSCCSDAQLSRAEAASAADRKGSSGVTLDQPAVCSASHMASSACWTVCADTTCWRSATASGKRAARYERGSPTPIFSTVL